MSNNNWVPSDLQKHIAGQYTEKDASASSQILRAYKNGDMASMKRIASETGIEAHLPDNWQETAEGTTTTRSGKIVSDGTRLWNDRGELNAMSNQDAFDRLRRHAEQTIWNDTSQIFRSARRMTAHQEAMLFDELQKEARNGRRDTLVKIADQLQIPVRRILDYIGFARKASVPHDVAKGEVPYYPIDPDVQAYVVAGDAAVAASRIETNRLFPEPFRIMAKVEIAIEQQAMQPYNVLERAKDKAVQDMQRKEDQRLANAWWIAGQSSNTAVILPPVLSIGAIENLAYQVDQNDLRATRIFMNRRELQDIRSSMVASFDPVTQREVFMTGMLGSLFDYSIFVTPKTIPPGFMFATTDPEYSTYMAIWINTTAEVANNFNQNEPVFGFLFYEMIAQTVVNDASVAVGYKSGSTIPAYFDPLV